MVLKITYCWHKQKTEMSAPFLFGDGKSIVVVGFLKGHIGEPMFLTR